jgi:hypothetical protein
LTTSQLITINDNDVPTFNWSSASQTINENAGTVTITASLNEANPRDGVEIQYIVSGSSDSSDHNATNSSISISSGNTTGSHTFTVSDDSDIETNETLIITMNTVSNAESGSTTIQTITIEDNDVPTLNWSMNSQSISEDGGSIVITATLTEVNPRADVELQYTINGTSTPSSDHDAVGSSLIIPSGSTSITKSIAITDDNDIEENETLILTISTVNDAEKGLTITQLITINDNDVPTFNWTSASQTINENAGTVTITASLNEVNPRDNVEILFSINGTSTQPSDHDAVDGTITIPTDSMSVIKTFSITDDSLVELNETLVVTMDSVDNAEPGMITIHTISINDNDLPKISLVADDSYADEEGSSSAVLEVRLDQPNPRDDIEVTFQISGTSDNEDDFTITESPIVIETNATSGFITITVIDDEEVEPNETVIATLTNASNAEIIDNSETITIYDNDSPRIEWLIDSQEVWENVGTVSVTAKLDKTSFQDISADLVVNGSDHDLNTDSITIPTGLTSTNITFNIIKEPECEADESIKITLTNPQHANLGTIPVHTLIVKEICPDFDPGDDIIILEDTGLSSSTAWAENITTGAPAITSLQFLVSNDNSELFSLQPDIATDGDLTFTPKTDTSGSATVQAQLKSNDYYLSEVVSFSITVKPVNDCPVFSMPSELTPIDEDQGSQSIDQWITNIDPGATDESSQSLNFSINATNSDIFESGPDIYMDGTNARLSFKVKDNENGVSVVTVQLNDDGGTEDGGCNSIEKSFTITVNPLNDPPENTETPSISGVLQVDQTLLVNKGEWNDETDQSPGILSYSYQWEVADTLLGTNNSPISNETNDTLGLSSSLKGKFVRCIVTASDDGEGLPSSQLTSKGTKYVGPVKGLPVVSFVDNAMRVNEEVGQVQIAVKLGRSSDVDVSLPYSISGSANNSDYTLLSNEPLLITKGHTKAYILFDIANDTDYESNETIIVEFGTPTDAITGSISRYTITIKENDLNPEITQISPSESYAGGGINVIIIGDNFVSGAEVTFDDLEANSMVVSKDKISCLVPSYNGILSQDTNVTVTVTNPGGNYTEYSFTYLSMKTISGRVTANDGTGITNCIVEVSLGYKTSRTLSDENGYYTVSDLTSSDKYIVSAWPDKELSCYNSQYYNGTDVDNADAVSTINGSRNDIHFSLETCANGQISGRVKDENGDAIDSGELLVTAFSESLGESGFTVPEPDGSYTIKGLKNADDYEVSVLWTTKTDTDYYYAIPESETVGEYDPVSSVVLAENATKVSIDNNHISKIDIIIDANLTGTIAGHVYDCSGNAMAYVFVFAKSDALNIQKTAFTDRNGHFSITDLPIVENADRKAKGYIISAKKINYPARYYGDTYNVNEASLVITGEQNIDISGLGCGYTISGQITDESGSPVSMVPILAKSISDNSKDASGTAYSNLKGDYSITSLMPLSDYIVHAIPMNHMAQYYSNKSTLSEANRVDLSSGNQTEIHFVLSEGPKLCGAISINGSPANEGIPVNIWSENTQTGGTILTDTNGLYELRGLDPDANDYVISVILSDYLPSFYHSSGTTYKGSEAEKIAASDTCDKDIDVIDGYSILGRVTFDDQPVYTVVVEAFSDDGGWGIDVSRRIPGSDNNFIIKGLKPGDYEVMAEVKQQCYSVSPYDITITDKDVELEIELSNACSSIYGTIHNLETDKTVLITTFSQSTLNYETASVTGPDNSYSITNLKPASDYIVFLTSEDSPRQFYQNQTSWSDADFVDISTGDQTGIDFTLIVPASISGKLTFNNGVDGDNAFVIASSESTNTVENVQVTYPETEYTLTLKPASDYIISVMSFKYNSSPSEQLVDASSDKTGIDFELSSGAEISGNIYDENGEPVSGLTVEAWSDSVGVWSGGVTDNTGSYTIKGLKELNDYIIYVDDPTKSFFYYNVDGTVKDASNASLVSVADGNADNIDISFFAVENISGTVMDGNGQALSGIWVYARSDTEQSGNGCKTNSDGSFVISGLTPAIDYLVEAKPNSASTYRSDKKYNIASGSSNIIFMLQEGFTLSGVVTNNDGDPLSKVYVDIRSISEDFSQQSKTNSQGYYEIQGIVPASDYKIMTTASGEDSYVSYKESIAISNDMTKNISLAPGFKLSGYVKIDNTGIKDVNVQIISLTNSFFALAETDNWGYYEVNNVPAGSDFEITAKPTDYAQQTQVDQSAGTEVNFNLSTGGPISGYVRDANFNPLSDVRIKLTSSFLNLPEGTTTDSNGYYILNGLQKYDLSGNYITDYVITVSSSEYPTQEESNVKVDDTVNFTLVSMGNNKLSGIVKDNTGSTPPSEKYVYVYLFKKQASGGKVGMIKTDENGQFEFAGLQSDQEYQLRFKILKGDNKNTKRWSGTSGPTSDRDNATDILPGNDVTFQFNVTW